MKQQLNTALGQASLRGLILLLPILGNLLFLANAKADLADLNVNLIIEVEGLRNKSGQICTTLFNQAEGFPSDSKKAFKSQCIEIKDIPQNLTFTELKQVIMLLHYFTMPTKMVILILIFCVLQRKVLGFLIIQKF